MACAACVFDFPTPTISSARATTGARSPGRRGSRCRASTRRFRASCCAVRVAAARIRRWRASMSSTGSTAPALRRRTTPSRRSPPCRRRTTIRRVAVSSRRRVYGARRGVALHRRRGGECAVADGLARRAATAIARQRGERHSAPGPAAARQRGHRCVRRRQRVLRVPNNAFLHSYAPNGGLLPPLFEPQTDPDAADRLILFGSAEAPRPCVRIARRSPVLPTVPW